MKVYVHKDGKQYGPYPIEQLRKYVEAGNFTLEDLACHDGQNWVKVGKVPGFAVPTLAASLSPTAPRRNQVVQKTAVARQPAPANAVDSSSKKKVVLWSSIGGIAVLLVVAGLLIWLLGGEDGDSFKASPAISSEKDREDLNEMRKKLNPGRTPKVQEMMDLLKQPLGEGEESFVGRRKGTYTYGDANSPTLVEAIYRHDHSYTILHLHPDENGDVDRDLTHGIWKMDGNQLYYVDLIVGKTEKLTESDLLVFAATIVERGAKRFVYVQLSEDGEFPEINFKEESLEKFTQPEMLQYNSPDALKGFNLQTVYQEARHHLGEEVGQIVAVTPPVEKPKKVDQGPDAPVLFKDAKLEAAVRKELKKPDGSSFTHKDLAMLESLNAPKAGITSLAGLEYSTNLTKLMLWNNQITEVTSLANLTKLTSLNLSLNQIAEVNSLSKLTNLTKLNLTRNQITNVAPLDGLTNLTNLELAHNQITDAEPLANLTNLTLLDLSPNKVRDVTPLANLTKLDTLDLGYNLIADVAPLTNLTNLTVLLLGKNPIPEDQKVMLRKALPKCRILF